MTLFMFNLMPILWYVLLFVLAPLWYPPVERFHKLHWSVLFDSTAGRCLAHMWIVLYAAAFVFAMVFPFAIVAEIQR